MADGQGQGPKDPIYTNRVEDKYIFNISDLDEILEVVEDRLDPSYVVPSDFCLVSSTYLDSPNMKFLKQSIGDANTSYKLRVRSYAPDGKWNDDKFLEVKYKVSGVKKKARIKVNAYGLLEAIGGKPIPDKMKDLNKDLPAGQFESAVTLINKITKGGVNPVIKVTYKRLSYRGKDLRTTLDQKLKVEAYDQIKNYQSTDAELAKIAEIANKLEASSQGVWELKHQTKNEAPTWIDNLVDKFKQGDQGFSKYLWGLNEVLS